MSVFRKLADLQPATDLIATDRVFVTQSGVAKSATVTQILNAATGTDLTVSSLTVTNASTLNTVTASELTLSTALAITSGGTGATTASGARTNLGLGTIATQDANAVAITGGSVDGTIIGGTTAAAGSFTTLNATGGGALTGTWTDLGTVTTVDINGGTVDGAVIGGNSAAAGTFTTLNATGGGALTGTWSDLGTVTTVDINGGTIDGTVIGGSSAAAGTFTTLNATGGGSLTGTWSDLGTVTTIDINGGTVDGTVIGGSSPAAGTFTTITGSGDMAIDTDTLFVDVSTNRVGIGTSSPSAPLQVNGTAIAGRNTLQYIEVSGSDSGNFITGVSASGNAKPLILRADANSGALELKTLGSQPVAVSTNDIEAVRIDSSGNVGIGTSSPAYKLQVLNGSDDPIIFRVDGTDVVSEYISLGVGTGTGILTAGRAGSGDTDLVIRTANSGTEAEVMRVTGSGNVGIGTSSPDEVLDVEGGDVKIGVSGSNAGRLLIDTTTDTIMRLSVNRGGSTGQLAFHTGADTEAVRIDSSGDVIIGDTATDTTAVLEVAGSAVARAGMPLITESGTSRTLALSDNGAYIRTTSGSATTVTVPPNSSVAFDTGAEIVVFQSGAGQVTFAAGAGVTINSKDGDLKLTGQYSSGTLKKVATDTWDLIGDLTA